MILLIQSKQKYYKKKKLTKEIDSESEFKKFVLSASASASQIYYSLERKKKAVFGVCVFYI
jgi:hypothetical protein